MGNLTNSVEKALVLIASVKAAIKNGVRHYDRDGNLLSTADDIMGALAEDGYVRVDETDKIDVASVEEEIENVRKEYANRIQ